MNLVALGNGRVLAQGETAQLPIAAALAIVGRRTRDGGEPVVLPELGEVWLKGGALSRHAAWRHGLAWRLLRRPPPRIAECLRLAELCNADVPAAEPLFAVAEFRGVRCVRQTLALRFEGGAEPFAAALERSGERRALLLALAALVAKLHGAGFEHRDLFLRNVLVTPRGLRLLDLWRPAQRSIAEGGLGAVRSANELGQLLLEAEPLLAPDERSSLLESYLDQRAETGASFDRARFSAAVARARAEAFGARARELRRAAKKARE